MHRAVLGPTPRPTGGHEPDPFKQTRNGPLTGTKRPTMAVSTPRARASAAAGGSAGAAALVHGTGLRREGEAHLAISISLCLALRCPEILKRESI
jgi:hypothetical protein